MKALTKSRQQIQHMNIFSGIKYGELVKLVCHSLAHLNAFIIQTNNTHSLLQCTDEMCKAGIVMDMEFIFRG